MLSRIVVISFILIAGKIILLAQTGSVSVTPAQTVPTAVARPKATLAGHSKNIVAIAFSPDGGTAATGSEDGIVHLWSTKTRERLTTLSHPGRYESLKIAWS